MGVVDLDAVKVGRLAKHLAIDLVASGTARAAVADLDDVDRWRRAARSAGRSLGWSLRTGVSAGWVWAASEDWESPPGADRDAARRVAAVIGVHSVVPG